MNINCVLYEVRAEAEERFEHHANNTTYHKKLAVVLLTKSTIGKIRRGETREFCLSLSHQVLSAV